MNALTRILELVLANRKLTSARPHVINALGGLAIVTCLGVFATVLLALMLCALLWLSYAGMLAAGTGISLAAGIITAVTGVLVAITLAIALRIWKSVRAEVVEVFRTQTPLAPVTDTANAFINGIMARRSKTTK